MGSEGNVNKTEYSVVFLRGEGQCAAPNGVWPSAKKNKGSQGLKRDGEGQSKVLRCSFIHAKKSVRVRDEHHRRQGDYSNRNISILKH